MAKASWKNFGPDDPIFRRRATFRPIEPVIDLLVQRGLPVTHDNYIALAYTDESPELDAESGAIIHEALAQHRAAVAAEKAIRRLRRRWR